MLPVGELGDKVTLYLENSLQSIGALRFELKQDTLTIVKLLHASNVCIGLFQ